MCCRYEGEKQLNIRHVCLEDEKKTDEVLRRVAERADHEGITLAGTVQVSAPDAPQEKCHIILALLPDAMQRDISYPTDPAMSGCRLNPDALEEAAMIVQERLPAAQALIVNKFGRQEATGRGLVCAIGDACERGLPVLVGVAPQWLDAFLAFADGSSKALDGDEDHVLAWLRSACAAQPDAIPYGAPAASGPNGLLQQPLSD